MSHFFVRTVLKAVPDIVDFKILSDVNTGVGMRFRETRLIKGKEAVEELEVTEYVENDRIRMVAESYGTVWDSLFTVAGNSLDTELKLTMEAKANTLFAKVLNPIMKGMIEKKRSKRIWMPSSSTAKPMLQRIRKESRTDASSSSPAPKDD